MENLKQSTDMRCIKTKKAIKNALANLMTEKDISQITVTDISELAMINRKTFYAHYSSVYDILGEIENEIISSLSEIIDNTDFVKDRFDPRSIFEKLTAIIYKDFDFYKYLLQSKTYSNLVLKIKDSLKARLLEVMSANFKGEKAQFDYALEFISAGIIAAYQQWFNSDRQRSLDEVSEIVSTIAFNGINTLIDQEA